MKASSLLSEVKEPSHRRSILIERAEELIKSHCKDASFRRPLWRGFSGKDEAYLIHAETSTRSSANTSNHYTIILDHFLPNLGYPKRSASIILANNENKRAASGFGTVYAIFPYDDVKIGVCEDRDIWFTTNFYIGLSARPQSIEHWNTFFNDAGISDFSFEDLVNSIEETITNEDDEYYHLMIKIFGKDPDNIVPILKQAYSAKNLNMNLATTKTIHLFKGPRELWIGGKCIAIREDIWEEKIRELEDKNGNFI